MSSECCPDCGSDLDPDDDSHAGFCPLCGTHSSESFDDDDNGESADLDEFLQTGRKHKAVDTRREATLPLLLAKYRADRRGLRFEKLLRDVCLECSGTDVSSERGKHECLNRKCKAKWYANHCWKCADGGVDSRDGSSLKCVRCGWRNCFSCGACSKSCPRGAAS